MGDPPPLHNLCIGADDSETFWSRLHLPNARPFLGVVTQSGAVLSVVYIQEGIFRFRAIIVWLYFVFSPFGNKGNVGSVVECLIGFAPKAFVELLLQFFGRFLTNVLRGKVGKTLHLSAFDIVFVRYRQAQGFLTADRREPDPIVWLALLQGDLAQTGTGLIHLD